MNDDTKRVWSSDGGRVRDDEQRPEPAAPSDGIARISRETKGRRGKTVTVVRGLGLPPAELAELASKLKKRCGVGGSAADGVITIQGDKVEAVSAALDPVKVKSNTVWSGGRFDKSMVELARTVPS